MYIWVLLRQPPILIMLYHVYEGRLKLKIVGIDWLTPDPRIIVINNGSKIISQGPLFLLIPILIWIILLSHFWISLTLLSS